MTIYINDAIRESMLKQAKASYPLECCGFIVGSRVMSEDSFNVKGGYFVACDNKIKQHSRRRFLINPEIYQQVEDDAQELGLMIISIVHSHPDHSDSPSEFDRLHAWPGVSYIIISVCNGRIHSYNSWRLADDRSKFMPEDIIRGG
ncbi:MAG: M67 family metallopeptidase [Gammaproteobacteria bacterium]|nr:M67 family metallopeptidase [Gammaproteobacteria bacterium]